MVLYNCEFLYGIKKRSYKGYIKANDLQDAINIINSNYPGLSELELKEADLKNTSIPDNDKKNLLILFPKYSYKEL